MNAKTQMTDDFDEVFAAAAEEDQESAPQTEEPEQDEQAEETAEAEQAEETAEAEEVEESEDEEAAAEAEDQGDADQVEDGGEAPEAEAPEEDDETGDVLKRLAALVAKGKEDQPQQEEPAPEAQAQQDEPPIYTDEEQETLKQYHEDWPEVAHAESLKRRGEYRKLVSFVFAEVAKELKPIMETVGTLAERTHMSDLQTRVNDYEDVRDKVVDWVKQQPTYLQPAYQHVIERGTVDEVADLIERYRRDTGAAAPEPQRKQKATELPPAAKKAATALAPVSSKRSAVTSDVDPEDFSAAFEAFASKL